MLIPTRLKQINCTKYLQVQTGTLFKIYKRSFKIDMGFFYRHIPSRLLDLLKIKKLCFLFDKASNIFNWNCHLERSVPCHYRCLWKPFCSVKLCGHLRLPENTLKPRLPSKRRCTWMDFFAVSFVVGIAHKVLHSFCLLLNRVDSYNKLHLIVLELKVYS